MRRILWLSCSLAVLLCGAVGCSASESSGAKSGTAGGGGSQSAGTGTPAGGGSIGGSGPGGGSTGVGDPGASGTAGSRGCTGACAPGATCTIDPPAGSRVPSIACTCSAAGAWCCDDQTCLDGAGGAGGAGSGGAGTGGGGGASNGSCAEDCESRGFTCCDGRCVNTGNDIFNCGACGVTCDGPDPYCDGTACGTAPCDGCTAGQLCCSVNLGVSRLECFDPVDGTCPQGCPFCDCASAQTLVATPSGEVRISEVRVGDFVYGAVGDAIVPVRVLQTNRVAVQNHKMVRVHTESGRTVLMSPRHPTAQWVRFDALEPGDLLGTDHVESAEIVPYDEPFTYDILTEAPAGAYFADGVLVGSTLAR